MSDWKAYGELAWTERLLSGPEDYRPEAELCIELIRQSATAPVKTLLHLACGAGGHDRFFSGCFEVTGVDISPVQLQLAREHNPGVEYIEGDMRSIRLDRQFDAVAIPDSIDYMATRSDLEAAIATAVAHLKPGGVLLVAAKTAETFHDNNFVYTGEGDGVQVTVFENNHVPADRPESYEAVMVYLVRRNGQLTIDYETHRLGLFGRAYWDDLFACAGLQMRTVTRDDFYDRWLQGEGSYPMTFFVGHLMTAGNSEKGEAGQ
jgi:SAM-dependent methyltransferase